MEDVPDVPEMIEEVMVEAVETVVVEMAVEGDDLVAPIIEAATTTTSCEIFPPLSLPTPLQPLFSTPNTLISPLFVFAVTMLLFSLLLAHKFSKIPIQQVGQVGPRGRKYYSWNESTTGGCGGRFFDWWMFGGSVWIRAALCLWDGMAGDHHNLHANDGGHHHSSESTGENLFACIGVVGNKSDGVSNATITSETEGDLGEDDGNKKADNCDQQATAHATSSTGIFGYDSSLGGFGPIFLAPIRASVFLIGWCSVCSFLKISYNELVDFASKLADPASGGQVQQIPLIYREKIGSLIVSILSLIQDVMSAGEHLVETKSDALRESWLPTIVYATCFIVLLEISLYVIGKTFMLLKVYVPRGVSHPGGPRPHKIMRMPQWTEGKEHFLSQQLLSGDCSSTTISSSSDDKEQAVSTKWRCAVAHDSHRDTIAKFNYIKSKDGDDISSKLMTGEPFGRQIWTLTETQPPLHEEVSEDDMEKTLKNDVACGVWVEKEQKNYEKEKKSEHNNILGPLSPLGDLVQNIFSFDSKEGKDKEPSEEKVNSKLIETLASGGRKPMSFDPSKNPNSCDQIFRAQMISSYLEKNDGMFPEDIAHLQDELSDEESSRPKTASEAAKRGVAFYSLLQTTDGHWAGDYGGPHFLMPGLIVAWYVMGCPSVMISPPHQALMLHYFKVHQQADGGWGTHIESPSTMFGTVVCYLAARLLGARKDEDWIKAGRKFIQNEGGAVMTSSWAKFWLCLVGCMDWKGHNSVPPEMWLLPNWFPFHPGRLWCHCRMVYLPMGYLYGSRFVYSEAETDPLIEELRTELYCEPYDSIEWDRTRHLVASMDNYSPIPT